MQARHTETVKTFSIGYREQAYSESHHARNVAAHIGTEHLELEVTPAQALEVVAELPDWYDEPFADSSQIPTLLLSRLTRAHVTVALSGDGGDEVFGGYNRYLWLPRLWRRFGAWPRALRNSLACLAEGLPPGAWDGVASLVPERSRPRQFGDKLWKAADALRADDIDAAYQRLVTHWPAPRDIVKGVGRLAAGAAGGTDARSLAAIESRMQLLDMQTYLPDDILTKVDRASMAASLEARVPLLDHRLVEAMWRVPLDMKIRAGEGKWLLRRILYKYVPRTLLERPKMGFAVPIDAWLRGPLRDWAEALLDEGRLRREGWLEPDPVRRAWREHLSGRHNWQHRLWAVLMFQAWQERWL
jgi:asparagine synthase (glutamine-hydrolysing)